MWIIHCLTDRIRTFADFGKGMEWWSIYSPIWSIAIFIFFGLAASIAPLPSKWFLVITLLPMLIIGYWFGDTLQKKMDEAAAEQSIREEMQVPLPYVQLQTVVLAFWLAYGILIVRIW